MKTTTIIVLAAIVALATGVLLQHKSSSTNQSMPVSQQLDFSFPDVNGQMQSVAQWRGRILVINFWATWCPPCLKEIPELIKWQQAYQDQSLQFVGIAIEDRQSVVDYLQTININYPILIAGDAGSTLSRQLGNIISAVPFTVIVNSQGQIIHRQPGELSYEQFLQVVQPLLSAK
jgi:thiol-disulfide isomerase/thioredoxin